MTGPPFKAITNQRTGERAWKINGMRIGLQKPKSTSTTGKKNWQCMSFWSITDMRALEMQCQGRAQVNGAWQQWHKISATVYENRKRWPRAGYETRIVFA